MDKRFYFKWVFFLIAWLIAPLVSGCTSDTGAVTATPALEVQVFQKSATVLSATSSPAVGPQELPAGKLLVVAGGQVILSSADGQQQQILTSLPSDSVSSASVSISPDGSKLAYFDVGMLTILDLDTHLASQYDYDSSGGAVGAIAWSPDSRQVGFGCLSFATSHLELCTLNVESGQREVLTDFRQQGFQGNNLLDGVRMGNWSADGSRIVFLTLVFPEASGYARSIIQLYHSQDGSVQQVLDDAKGTDPIHFEMPSLSPDGNTILFSAKSGDHYGIYQVRADGSGLERVTPASDNFNITNPIWSPDGKSFVAAAQDQKTTEMRDAPSLFSLGGDLLGQLDNGGLVTAWIDPGR